MKIRQYIDDLFRYISTYESNYSAFDFGAFQQTYNGIRAVFTALREYRDQAVETDYTLLDFIHKAPLKASDLRELTVQTLVTWFEMEVDVDNRSNQAYSYIRGLREVKQDVSYIEEQLLPKLFQPGALNNNFQLHNFFLVELASFMNAYGRPLMVDLTPEQFEAKNESQRVLELCRRRLQLGDALIQDRSSLEFHLQRVGYFERWASTNKLVETYLESWDYQAPQGSWIARLKKIVIDGYEKFKGLFRSYRYTTLMFSQRRPAYFLTIFLIVVWIGVGILAPVIWSSYSDGKLQKLRDRVDMLKRY
ncbi:hypothetical protein GF356_10235 [candidate division GN15 bacterium]|nr:hypothetical protein [candidate division GN15 bacterium]